MSRYNLSNFCPGRLESNHQHGLLIILYVQSDNTTHKHDKTSYTSKFSGLAQPKPTKTDHHKGCLNCREGRPVAVSSKNKTIWSGSELSRT